MGLSTRALTYSRQLRATMVPPTTTQRYGGKIRQVLHSSAKQKSRSQTRRTLSLTRTSTRCQVSDLCAIQSAIWRAMARPGLRRPISRRAPSAPFRREWQEEKCAPLNRPSAQRRGRCCAALLPLGKGCTQPGDDVLAIGEGAQCRGSGGDSRESASTSPSGVAQEFQL